MRQAVTLEDTCLTKSNNMRIIISILFLILNGSAIAQESNDRPGRDSVTLMMPVSEENYYESRVPKSSFIVGPNILQLYPGDSIFLEIEHTGSKITDMKSVKRNLNPNKTLKITFIQTAEGNKHSNMILSVHNPFKQDLQYEALMRLMNTEEWVQTSIIPVKAGLVGIEMWQDIIVSIALVEWKFL
jgi:hypothetical protein